MKRVGVTRDGREVWDCFKAVDEWGVPLAVVLEFCRQRDIVFGWGAFLNQARKSGWNLSRKLPEWRNEVEDAFGKDYAEGWRMNVR